MIIDIAVFEDRKKFIVDWFNDRSTKDFGTDVAALSSLTYVPCIAVALWLGESEGWPPESIAKINSLIRFYEYTKIIGMPESCPVNL